jgi:hypothetical protein
VFSRDVVAFHLLPQHGAGYDMTVPILGRRLDSTDRQRLLRNLESHGSQPDELQN